MTRSLAAAAVLGLAAFPASPEAQSTSADAPLAVVQRLFDAMRGRDTAAMRALFDPNARLMTTTTRNGQPVLRTSSVEEWLGVVGGATVELDERIWDPSVEVDDRLATVWVKYELMVDGRFSHCGVDAFQLFQGAAGWVIFQVADTRRRENCRRQPT